MTWGRFTKREVKIESAAGKRIKKTQIEKNWGKAKKSKKDKLWYGRREIATVRGKDETSAHM